MPHPTQDLWPVVLPVAVGLVALYLLLPRPRSFPPVWGALAAAAALLLAGWFLVRGRGLSVETFLFYAFSAVALISAGLLVTQRNPVHAALSFALVVLSTCGLFLLQAAPFLMAATIIVYAGAIIVTFLFVIMLAQQAGLSNADARSREPLLSCIAGFVLLGTLLYALFVQEDVRAAGMLAAPFDGPAFAELLASTRKAAGQRTADEIAAAWEEQDALDAYRRAAEATRGGPGSRELSAALTNIRRSWVVWRTAGATDEMRTALHRLADAGAQVERGRDASGRARLPAANVAALGQTLFTDYLFAVELGGTLLLIATVGAIAITGRRAEGLR